MIIYFHIPFCLSKCGYCAFNSFTTNHSLIPQYFNTLLVQLTTSLQKLPQHSVKSIFFGGGTPSIVPSKYYAPIFKLLNPYLTHNAEITIEANPNSMQSQWIKDLVSFGVNRLSFGVQSFHAKKLHFLEREHTLKHIYTSMNEAVKSGLNNINIDLIYGTPFDSIEFLRTELQEAINLPITHISTYCLSLDSGSKFERKTNLLNKIATLQTDLSLHFKQQKNTTEQQAYFVANFLKEKGFLRYEVSNFALKAETKCRHNLSYWNYENCLAFGAGAVGFSYNKKQARRFFYPKDLSAFLNNQTPFIEHLKQQEVLLERLFLGFRSEIGVLKSLLNKEQLHKAAHLLNSQKITQTTKRLYAKEFLLGDELALYLWD